VFAVFYFHLVSMVNAGAQPVLLQDVDVRLSAAMPAVSNAEVVWDWARTGSGAASTAAASVLRRSSKLNVMVLPTPAACNNSSRGVGAGSNDGSGQPRSSAVVELRVPLTQLPDANGRARLPAQPVNVAVLPIPAVTLESVRLQFVRCR
jgi:hypothetical protein